MGKPNVSVVNFDPGPGSLLIADTAVHEGKFRFVEAFGAVEIAEMDNRSFNPADAFDGFTLDDGRILQGDIRSIQLTSGTLVAYT
jgi:hypothetical protein